MTNWWQIQIGYDETCEQIKIRVCNNKDYYCISLALSTVRSGLYSPLFGASGFGSASSALMPQTTIVSPCLIIEDPSAVDIDPTDIATGRKLLRLDLPSGLSPCKKAHKIVMLWKIRQYSSI